MFPKNFPGIHVSEDKTCWKDSSCCRDSLLKKQGVGNWECWGH